MERGDSGAVRALRRAPGMMKRTILSAALSALLAAAGCAEPVAGDAHPTTLDTVAADVRIHAYVIGEQGDPPIAKRLIVTLERWSGNAGNAYHDCPSFPGARARVNGVEASSDAGGAWSELGGCTLPVFAVDVAAIPNALDADRIVVEIADESRTLRMVTTNMFVAPRVSWQAPADGALHAGQVAHLAISPAPRALILDEVFFLPDAPNAAAQAIDTSALDLGDEGLSFVVPALPAGKGSIVIEGGNRPIFGAAVLACEGVTDCFVQRAACVDDGCEGYSSVPLSLDEPVYLPATVME
jgi:hypothetical protein